MFESNLALQIAATRGNNTALADEQALRRPRLPESAQALSDQDADLLLSSSAIRRRRRERGLKMQFLDNNSDQFRPFRVY